MAGHRVSGIDSSLNVLGELDGMKAVLHMLKDSNSATNVCKKNVFFHQSLDIEYLVSLGLELLGELGGASSVLPTAAPSKREQNSCVFIFRREVQRLAQDSLEILLKCPILSCAFPTGQLQNLPFVSVMHTPAQAGVGEPQPHTNTTTNPTKTAENVT